MDAFSKFLSSIKSQNPALIESIADAYQTIHEVDSKSDTAMRIANARSTIRKMLEEMLPEIDTRIATREDIALFNTLKRVLASSTPEMANKFKMTYLTLAEHLEDILDKAVTVIYMGGRPNASALEDLDKAAYRLQTMVA